MNIKKRCNEINCKRLVNISETYCSEHKQESNKQYDRLRQSTDEGRQYIDFYKSTEWRNLRYQALLDEGFCCRHCGLEANIGDHIIPIKVRWDLRLDINNIQPLCRPCHIRVLIEWGYIPFRLSSF